MDYKAINDFNLPIELMMENAGLQLARLVSLRTDKTKKITIGIGKGNNGGGGLVAARRLLAWGYNVYLHIPDTNLNSLANLQFLRSKKFGTKITTKLDCDIFVDAYLGFSQRLPLPVSINESLQLINKTESLKISLDLPTGFDLSTGTSEFSPDIILTMAAMKTELIPLLNNTQVFIADLGIPRKIYSEFGIKYPYQFSESGILEVV
ncbi:MAG: NAD(P)H-hydrate epimerase [Marinilabiliales bacterium]|nr:MAG: NAD(P)H-hydrate epimerase [Marinilabiliales bacterium]